MIFAVEPFSVALLEEAHPLLQQHWQEVALYQGEVSLEVDVDFYLRLAAQGKLVCFTARCEGQLAGYAAFFLTQHPHYRALTVVRNDVLFVLPERRGVDSVRFIYRCEQHFREQYSQRPLLLTWHAKLSNDFAALLGRLGYQKQEVLLGKLL